MWCLLVLFYITTQLIYFMKRFSSISKLLLEKIPYFFDVSYLVYAKNSLDGMEIPIFSLYLIVINSDNKRIV